jgi:hypothetical protein
MAANTDAMLREAVRAMQNGKNDEAQMLLIKVTEYDESNVQAWMLLFDIVDEIEDKQVCLHNALAFEPENAEALRKSKALDLGIDIPPTDLSTFLPDTPTAKDYTDEFDDAFDESSFGEIDAPPKAKDDQLFDLDTGESEPVETIEPDLFEAKEASSQKEQATSTAKSATREKRRTKRKLKFPAPDTDPDTFFIKVPTDIEATRLPGESEKYHSIIMPLIITLLILNIGAIVWLYVNSDWCSYMECWAG